MSSAGAVDAPEAERMDISKIAPDGYGHLVQLDALVGRNVESTLLHLIKLRASQINGCAFCTAMHTHESLRKGEQPLHLTSLDAWRDTTLYTDRERAALNWVEELTLIATRGASKTAYDHLLDHFTREEVAWLTLAGTIINAWTRIATASRLHYPMKAAG